MIRQHIAGIAALVLSLASCNNPQTTSNTNHPSRGKIVYDRITCQIEGRIDDPEGIQSIRLCTDDGWPVRGSFVLYAHNPNEVVFSNTKGSEITISESSTKRIHFMGPVERRAEYADVSDHKGNETRIMIYQR